MIVAPKEQNKKRMWIWQLRIENFRGIRKVTVEFSERQTVLVGANGAGKSTIIEAIALLFGRDRLVRSLTEHDFFGSNPKAEDRIRLVATVTGFNPNSSSAHSQWFSERRGVPKWRDHASGKVLPEQQSTTDALCVQIAFCARFDRSDLEVETIRYFHDDDAVSDPFDEDVVQPISRQLVTEFGFFLVPAHRTWDRLVSFNSELFRRILDSTGTLEAVEVLAERDRLREDTHRIDLQGALKEIREGIDVQLKQLLPGDPGLELRLTGTDTESLLQALVPHYRYAGSVSLPAGRHGSGLLSLQTALLVLQIAERRRKANQNVFIAVEEPELHMPPGVQAHILHRLGNCSNQLVCTTHSPRVAAVCPAIDIRLVNAGGGACGPVAPVLKEPLPDTAKNGIRKLFHENRQSFIEAIMHRFVVVPEGRTDAEWLRLMGMCAITDQNLTGTGDPLPFGTIFGVVPTHDGCVVDTVEQIRDVRSGVVALVDGDGAGDDYVKALLKSAKPPDHVLQWPVAWLLEDVIGWILGKEEDLAGKVQAERPAAPGSIAEIVQWLKTPTNESGAKTDFLAYEAVAGAILTSATAKDRARTLLGAFMVLTDAANPSGSLQVDKDRTTATTSVWRFVL
jgi:putative ATP-dependent endonuclease of OLD family